MCDVGEYSAGNNAMKVEREVLSLAGSGRDTQVPQTFERGMPPKTGSTRTMLQPL